MGAYYDEIEIEDMVWDEDKRVYHYPCPCGDRFEISRKQLANYEDIATCPGCSLVIRIVYDPLDYEDYDEGEDDVSGEEEDDSDGEDSDLSDDDDDKFEDALESCHIADEPIRVAVVA